MTSRYYGSAAEEYNHFAKGSPYDDLFQACVAEQLQNRDANSKGTFLEIGSGTGLTTAKVVERFPNARIVAVDSDLGMIEYTRELFSLNKNIIWHCADAYELLQEFEPGMFDAVYSSYCMHNLLPIQRVTIYDHIGKILKPGAPLVIGDKIIQDDPVKHQKDFEDLVKTLVYYDSIQRPDLKEVWMKHYFEDNANPLTEDEQCRLFHMAWCSGIQFHNRWMTDAVMSAVRFTVPRSLI